MAIFDQLGLRNPWTDRVKIWHDWLCLVRDPACKNWWPSDKGGGVGVWVKLSPHVLFLVSRIRPQLTLRSGKFSHILPPKKRNFGGVNRHFKPNLQKKMQIPISSKLFIGFTKKFKCWCNLTQRLRGWSYMNIQQFQDGGRPPSWISILGHKLGVDQHFCTKFGIVMGNQQPKATH